MEALKIKLRQFAEERNWGQYHSPKNLATALMIEAAELAEHFRWLTQDQSYDLDSQQLEKVCDEVGDILICLINFSDKFDIDPLQCAETKIEKNRIKYPAGK
ncbi:MAG: nucleotide pyrophosphohydrolase [Deltaproteobacteria bacterium]|nr:nucleotide pyrophosphohydrolase [Deltaproteobacteria bacterium]